MAIAVGITVLARTFVIDTISVASGSMEPTLAVGTHYRVNRWIYRVRAPERGDIVDLKAPWTAKPGSSSA